MKGAISIKGQKYYTNMEAVFEAIENKQNKYNWLISNFECNHYPDNLLNQDYIWISGEKLTEMVSKYDIQFIWGVFSAFEKEVLLDEVLKHELPYADGYTGFWNEKVSIQHDLALIEIVPWDSSLVLFISKDDFLTNLFINNFPMSIDLDEYNSTNTNQQYN